MSTAEPALWLPRPDVDALKAYFTGVTLQDVMQLRMPLFLAVVLGRFGFSYAWLLMMMQFTLSLYALFRTRRAELRSHIDSKNIEQLKAQIAEEKARAKLERLSSSARCKGPDATAVLGTKWEEIGTERPKTGTEISNEGLAAALETKLEFEKTEWEAFQVSNLTVDSFIEVQKKYLRPAPVPVEGEAKYLPMLSLAGELYLHVIAGQILAYQIGYYRMDTVLMLPLVEMLRGYAKKIEWERKFSARIPDAKRALFYETMSVNPVEVQDEWFNLLLAQFWQVFGRSWVSEYVRGWIEIFTVKLGLITEVCDFGTLPLQVRKLEGKKRTMYDGSTIQRAHSHDWIYDLDLHLELDTDELLIRLAFPVAGFNFPLYVDHLRLSGPFRVEFEFLELDERDARAANATMPGLAGMKIYFTERPEIELTLWIGGMFDLIGIPLIGWIIQKLVVDNIVCHGCKLGPNAEGKVGMDIWGNEHPVAGQVAKTLLLKARDRKRNAEADLDTAMSMACRISVKLVSALNLPAGDVYCIFKYGSKEQVEMEEPAEGITFQSRAQKSKPQTQTLWGEKEDHPFEWETKQDQDVLQVALMTRARTGSDTQIGKEEITFGDLRRKLGGLQINRKAKVWECTMDPGHPEQVEIKVNFEVQFKGLADLPGIQVPAGTLLKDVQTIESASGEKDATQYFARKIPFKDVGGKLRIRLVKVDCLPKDCQHGQKIYTRIILGKQSDYGSKLCECKESLATPRAGAASFYAKKMTKSQAKKLNLTAHDSVAKTGTGASIEREWPEAEGRFEFDIPEMAHNNMLALQVWRDDALTQDDILGSTCLSIGDLASEHNGALFKRAAFQSTLTSDKGELVAEHGKRTLINFVAEFVPDIEFMLS